MSDLDAVFAQAEKEISDNADAFEAYQDRLQADDQSKFAGLVVWAFVGLIAVLALGVFLAMLFGRDWATLKDPAEFLLALISSVLLPVVTLVMGHYFGKKQASKS